jgi:hypothetical protein
MLKLKAHLGPLVEGNGSFGIILQGAGHFNFKACKFEKLTSGGYLFCNIPAFGPDPVFGNLFPLYLEAWGEKATGSRPFQTLHVDEWGYPLNGHLIWADTFWWVRKMEWPGFIREVEIEQALHQKYDAYLESRTPARKAFYVFSKRADLEKNRRTIETIQRTSSLVLENQGKSPSPLIRYSS